MSDETRDHRRVLAALAPDQRAWLVERSNWRGLLHLLGHAGLVAVFAALVASGAWLWPVTMVALGIAIMFLFTTLHEASHQTPFRTPWINRVVAAVCGFLVMVPAQWFWYFHMAHHRHTHDPDHDPELVGGKPETLGAYLLYISGLTVWRGNLLVLFRNAVGKADRNFVPEKALARLRFEAWLHLLGYALSIALSIWFGTAILFWIWLLPALIGQPFLRAYLLAEHTRCPHVANMLENSRTTFTWPVVRFIAWNMPFHAEHHAHPNVPFWKLPAFHRIVRGDLGTTERGYWRFHCKLMKLLGERS